MQLPFLPSLSDFPITATSLDDVLNNASNRGAYLGAVVLTVLADLSTIPRRTALSGSASFFDVLMLTLGIQG